MQPRTLFAFFGIRAHRCLMLSLVSTRTPRSFSEKLLSSLGLFIPKSRTFLFLFPFLSFMRFLLAHFCSLWRSLWMSPHPWDVLATPISSIFSVNLLRVHSLSPSRSLMKMQNSTGPSAWGTLLVTSLQPAWLFSQSSIHLIDLTEFLVPDGPKELPDGACELGLLCRSLSFSGQVQPLRLMTNTQPVLAVLENSL